MQTTSTTLPDSRVQYTVVLSPEETAEFFNQALGNLSAGVTVAGFRQGKAPTDLVRSQLKDGALREEAYSIAVRHAWNEIIKALSRLPIEDPSVEVEQFDEGKEGRLTFSFDVRPEVKAGSWQKITVKGLKAEPVTEKEIEDVLDSLARSRAKTIVKLGPAEAGDQVEVSFNGSIGGVRKDRLSGVKVPLVLGQKNFIPGFEEQVTGLKKNDRKTFTLKFPQEHFDKEFAGKEIEFEVEVHDVFQLLLLERNDEFAAQFGHKKMGELTKAIRQDLEKHKDEEIFIQQKAKWLSEFDKTITTDVPQSLVTAEVARSRQAWSQFLMERNLNAQDWLARRNTTMEQLEADWKKAAESSVRIGLGLAEVAKAKGKELSDNESYQQLLDSLVKEAVK